MVEYLFENNIIQQNIKNSDEYILNKALFNTKAGLKLDPNMSNSFNLMAKKAYDIIHIQNTMVNFKHYKFIAGSSSQCITAISKLIYQSQLGITHTEESYFVKIYCNNNLFNDVEYKMYVAVNKLLMNNTPCVVKLYARKNISTSVENLQDMFKPKIDLKTLNDEKYLKLPYEHCGNKFSIFIMQAITGYRDHYLSVHSFLNNEHPDINQRFTHDELIKICYQLFFQLCYTYIIFKKFGIRHNDLHSGNALVEYSEEPKLYYYHYKEHTYKTYSQFNLKIFDFDRSAKTSGYIIYNHNLDRYDRENRYDLPMGYTSKDKNIDMTYSTFKPGTDENIFKKNLCFMSAECNTNNSQADFIRNFIRGGWSKMVRLLKDVEGSGINEFAKILKKYGDMNMNISAGRFKHLSTGYVGTPHFAMLSNFPSSSPFSRFTAEYMVTNYFKPLLDDDKNLFNVEKTSTIEHYYVPSREELGRYDDELEQQFINEKIN